MTQKHTILLVEDDDRLRAGYAQTLRNGGYEVQEAGLVKTALMHLDIIDLAAIVLDLRLPNGYGKKVVDELRAKRDDVPVIVLTGYPEDAPRDFPVVEVLSKPVKGHVLMAAVRGAHRTSTAIRSIRSSTRKMGECLPEA